MAITGTLVMWLLTSLMASKLTGMEDRVVLVLPCIVMISVPAASTFFTNSMVSDKSLWIRILVSIQIESPYCFFAVAIISATKSGSLINAAPIPSLIWSLIGHPQLIPIPSTYGWIISINFMKSSTLLTPTCTITHVSLSFVVKSEYRAISFRTNSRAKIIGV